MLFCLNLILFYIFSIEIKLKLIKLCTNMKKSKPVPHFLDQFNRFILGISSPAKDLQLSFSPKEHLFIKGYLFNVLYRRAKRLCRKYHKQHLKKLSQSECGEEVMDNYLSYYIIQDLLETGNFTLEGIANEINVHMDVMFDISSGLKTNHSPAILYRLIQLHITVKRTWHADLFRRLLVVLGYW